MTLSGPTATLYVQASGSFNQRETADRRHVTQPEETSRCFRGIGHQLLCGFHVVPQSVSAGVVPCRGLPAWTQPGKRKLFTGSDLYMERTRKLWYTPTRGASGGQKCQLRTAGKLVLRKTVFFMVPGKTGIIWLVDVERG